MDLWDEIKKLSGYQSGNSGVDSYGVDHSGFSTRDELEYQSARLARENQLAENFSKQGIAEENYPQFGTNFWGGSPENNYGFGTSNIKQNIENMTNGLNNTGTNIGQVFANSDYTVNTESLIGKPSSYFQNNNSVFANSDYTVNTESLVGKPSSYFQNNNTTDWNNTGGFGSGINNSGFSTNTNMGATTNFGANPSFATAPNSIATSTAQNQTPTPWSYGEPSTTPTPWSTTTATPTPWDNNATNVQSSPTVQNVSNYNNIEAQKRAQALQAQRDAVNQILMNGMDVLYGMNRTINGMTAGGLDYLGPKLGFDSKMNNYLQLKNPQERELAQNVGQLVQLGGGALTGGALAKAGLNQANIAYNGYKIGKKYDQLVEDPFQGNGNDVIARMKNHNDEPVVLQRGEAIQGPNGRVITSGNELKRVVGTKRNYGLDKGIYKHEVSREDAQRIPRIIQQKPMETNSYGQNVYLVRSKNGAFRVVTSPKDDENIIATMYYVDR